MNKALWRLNLPHQFNFFLASFSQTFILRIKGWIVNHQNSWSTKFFQLHYKNSALYSILNWFNSYKLGSGGKGCPNHFMDNSLSSPPRVLCRMKTLTHCNILVSPCFTPIKQGDSLIINFGSIFFPGFSEIFGDFLWFSRIFWVFQDNFYFFARYFPRIFWILSRMF